MAHRHGAAAVEFGLALPLLILLLLGTIDLGRFAYSYIALTNAGREGAAFGSVHPVTEGTMDNWRQQVRDRVAEELQPVNPDDLNVDAARSVDPDGLWRVQVVVAYPFEMIVPWPLLPHRMEMRRSVEMRGIR